MAKRAIVCVTNDLATDQRVRKTCLTLQKMGFYVIETGTLRKDSLAFNPPYSIRRKRQIFTKGALFYAEYNIRLFCYLLFAKVDLIFSNDLDTLPAAYLVSKIRRKKIIYDTHEYFTEVPELVNRKKVQAIWKGFERLIFPKLKHIITVNHSIANMYSKEYGKNVAVVRNIPPNFQPEHIKTREELNLPTNKHILILQGSGINIDRGAEEAVEAMKYLDDSYLLLIVGSGDVIPQLKEMVIDNNLSDKVIFNDKMPFNELRQYTLNADLGLALDKDTNLNYRFSLPNKLFDYIHSSTPVLASQLPEIANIINSYQVGYFIETHKPKQIAEKIISIFYNVEDYNEIKANCSLASKELNWDNEEKKLIEVIEKLSPPAPRRGSCSA